MTFLETVVGEFNRMRARSFAGGGYEGVTHAGIVIVAAGSGRVLMTQRTMDPTDAPEVQQSWEFPGGGLDEGEEPWAGAVREFTEEVGIPFPETGEVINGWRSPDGIYQGFVYSVPSEGEPPSEWFEPNEEVQAVAWVDPIQLTTMHPDIKIRPEVKDFDTTLLAAATQEDNMSEQVPEAVAAATQVGTADEYMQVDAEGNDLSGVESMVEQEPILSLADVLPPSIPVHGVVAPEAAESGDARAFNDGSVTTRPLRLPFSWQKVALSAHEGSVVVGSVDRVMRKDGLIHWEGRLMLSDEACEFVDLLVFFGRFGVSIDGDRGNVDEAKTKATSVLWFDAVRMAGLTAVAIPAFAEAYVALGPHPDMPAAGTEQETAMVASGMQAGLAFDRGPGWVTNPKDTKRIHDYWMPGHPGGDKIRWGTDGDYTRCTRLVGEKIAANSPEKAGYIKQICAQWHHDALGYWPGDLGKPGNAPDTAENRKRAATHASLDEEVSGNETPEDIVLDEEGLGWEAVLVSSAGVRALPPTHYFDRHPDTGALVIEEPDEFGIRRTYGYVGEWGVCHIGKRGQCVEVPDDPTGDFADFHLGRTKTEAGYINTGVITYKVDHRDADTILSETPEQQHFDNIANAWCAVRLGTDDQGIWFSGVVLPHVPEEDVTLIEATGQVSGEWLYGSLRACQAVNVPGFPVVRASAVEDEEGNVIALVASAHGTSECAPSPREMMAALAQADAQARMEQLRKEAGF